MRERERSVDMSLRAVVLLDFRKRQKEIDQRTLVLASSGKNKYVAKERENDRARDEQKTKATLIPGNAMSLP
jgi:hypothetical protein